MAIKNLIQLRKGSSSEWSNANPILASGEPGYDLTNNIIKVGDGVTAWNNLSGIGSTTAPSSGSVDLDTTLIAGTGISFNYDSLSDSLYINISGNYASINHTHNINDITNFASGVSGLLPVIGVTGGSSVLVLSSGSVFTVSVTGLQPSGNYSLVDHQHTISDISDFNSGVSGLIDNIYAPLSSPVLTGVPLAPTAPSGTNSNQIASTAFVRTEISNLVASAPASLDTLNELASALGNDANFSTTVTNSLSNKANLSGANFTGSISSPTGNFTDSLNVNGTGVSLVNHSHTASAITDFNSSVSGLLPVTNITAGSGIGVSSSSGNFTINNTSPIVNYTTSSSFPTSGILGYYYLDSDSGRLYQWTGSYYAEIGPPISSVNNAQNAANLYLWSNFK